MTNAVTYQDRRKKKKKSRLRTRDTRDGYVPRQPPARYGLISHILKLVRKTSPMCMCFHCLLCNKAHSLRDYYSNVLRPNLRFDLTFTSPPSVA